MNTLILNNWQLLNDLKKMNSNLLPLEIINNQLLYNKEHVNIDNVNFQELFSSYKFRNEIETMEADKFFNIIKTHSNAYDEKNNMDLYFDFLKTATLDSSKQEYINNYNKNVIQNLIVYEDYLSADLKNMFNQLKNQLLCIELQDVKTKEEEEAINTWYQSIDEYNKEINGTEKPMVYAYKDNKGYINYIIILLTILSAGLHIALRLLYKI